MTLNGNATMTLEDLVFVGFNSQVVALDRYTGELAWLWKAAEGSGYAAVLVDGDRLIVSVQGYTYCLDPLSGQVVWQNPLKGMGVGTPCVASKRGAAPDVMHFAAAEDIAQQQRAAAATTTTVVP